MSYSTLFSPSLTKFQEALSEVFPDSNIGDPALFGITYVAAVDGKFTVQAAISDITPLQNWSIVLEDGSTFQSATLQGAIAAVQKYMKGF